MTNPADGAPLTRRQLREQAEAEAARTAAEAAPPAYAQPAPAAVPVQQPPAAREQPPAAQRPAPTAAAERQAPAEQPSAPTSQRREPAQRTGAPQVDPTAVPAAEPQGAVRRPTAQERQPGLSRRSLREQASAVSETGAVIVPPHQTGKIRTVDETGELTASRPARPQAESTGAASSSGASSPSAPPAGTTPWSSPAASGTSGARPAVQGAVAAGATMSFSQRLAASAPPSARPAGARPQTSTPQPQAAPTGQPPVARTGTLDYTSRQQAAQQTAAPQQAAGQLPTVQAPAKPTAARTADQQPNQRLGVPATSPAQVASPGSGPAGTQAWAPVAPADAPWTAVAAPAVDSATAPPRGTGSLAEPTTGTDPDATGVISPVDAVAGTTDVPPRLAEEPESFSGMPRWDAITTGAGTGAPAAGALHDDVETDDDADEHDDYDEPDHRYTWLHYVILVAVAFVLGLILWKVALEGESGASSASSALSVTATDATATSADQPGWTTDTSGAPDTEDL